MATLREQVIKLIPGFLSPDPDKAKGGAELCSLLKPKIDGDYAVNSLRQTISDLANEANSPVARRAGKFGYYLRADNATDRDSKANSETLAAGTSTKGRESQPEERFRAFYARFMELRYESVFAKHIEHTKAKKGDAGLNAWKFPDLVLLEWDQGLLNEDGKTLNKQLLEIRASLGQQPFRLISVELKVQLFLSSLRENFFQCVSNSKWSHKAVFAVASAVTDDKLISELIRLGSSHEVEVVSFNLGEQDIAKMPSADQIRKMSDEEFEDKFSNVDMKTIRAGGARDALDWLHIADLRNQLGEFSELFEWIHGCLNEGRARSFEGWRS